MADRIYLCDTGKILPVFVVSAVMCSDQGWAALTAQWDALLKAAPSLDFLNMTDAARLQGQFRGWSIPERDRKIDKFADLVNSSITRAAASLVPLECYQEFFLRSKRPKLIDMPFLFGLLGAMDELQVSADGQPATLCYHETQARMPDAVASWQHWKTLTSDDGSDGPAVTLDYCKDPRSVPLQAAAFVGALARSRFLDARLKSPDGRMMKVPQSCTSNRISFHSKLWTGAELRHVREGLKDYAPRRSAAPLASPRLSRQAPAELAATA